jgi:hypothetical protein
VPNPAGDRCGRLSASAHAQVFVSGQVSADTRKIGQKAAKTGLARHLQKGSHHCSTKRIVMDHIPPSAVTGAAMDTVVPKRRGRLLARIGAAAAVTAVLAWTGWQFVPHGLQVASRDLRLAGSSRACSATTSSCAPPPNR